MHWFLDPIQHQYADFTGRATRQQFWMFTLFYVLLFVAFEIVAQAMPILAPLSILAMIGLLLPSLAIGARRLHDHGKSGWWQLVGIIPFVGLVIFIILMALPGDEGENRFGPKPTAGSGTAPAAPTAPSTPEAAAIPEAEPAPAPEADKQ